MMLAFVKIRLQMSASLTFSKSCIKLVVVYVLKFYLTDSGASASEERRLNIESTIKHSMAPIICYSPTVMKTPSTSTTITEPFSLQSS